MPLVFLTHPETVKCVFLSHMACFVLLLAVVEDVSELILAHGRSVLMTKDSDKSVCTGNIFRAGRKDSDPASCLKGMDGAHLSTATRLWYLCSERSRLEPISQTFAAII